MLADYCSTCSYSMSNILMRLTPTAPVTGAGPVAV